MPGSFSGKRLPNQKRTEYYLTAACRELQPLVLGLGKWGMKWARGQMTDDELDVEMLMYDFSRGSMRRSCRADAM